LAIGRFPVCRPDVDTRLYTIQGKRGLDAFVNIGFADGTVNEITHTLNMGLALTGLLDERSNDKLGLAMSTAGVGNAYREAQLTQGDPVQRYETNFEMTYRAPITDWLTVQPDVQYWIHPNADPALKNDLVIGVHFEIGKLFGL
jgi:porin